MAWLGQQGLGGSNIPQSLSMYSQMKPPEPPPQAGPISTLSRPGIAGPSVGPAAAGSLQGDARAIQSAGFGPYANSIRNNIAGGMQRSMPAVTHSQHGIAGPGPASLGPNAVEAARMQGPSEAQIRADMERRKVGASLGPRNAALAGYMMG